MPMFVLGREAFVYLVMWTESFLVGILQLFLL